MNEKLIILHERRKYLIEQTEKQRATIAHAATPWRSALARADQGLAAIRYMKSHPIWLASAGGALLALLGPSRVMRWLARGWVGLQMLNRLRLR